MTARYFDVHERDPQPRRISQVVAMLQDDALIAYPTDSCYALGCALENRDGSDRIRRIRSLDDRHHFTLVCADFAQLGQLVQLNNAAFRAVKAATPGPYTFILPATRLVPDLALRRQKTVGIRIPDNPIALEIVKRLGHPVISTSAATPEGDVLIDAKDIKEKLGHGLDLILDGGYRPNEPSSVIDLSGAEPKVVRVGKGDVSDLVG